MDNFDLSDKEAVAAVSISFSIKQNAQQGTNEKLTLFLDELNNLIEKHKSEDIHYNFSIGEILTHKQKKQ